MSPRVARPVVGPVPQRSARPRSGVPGVPQWSDARAVVPTVSRPGSLVPSSGHRFWRGCFALAAAGVLALSLMPPGPADLSGFGWDKSNHLIAFGVLGVLAHLGWPQRPGRVIACLLGFGALIEVLQGLTDYRTAEWFDLVADGAGLAVARLLLAALPRPGGTGRDGR